MQLSFCKVKKELIVLFSIYIFLCIYIEKKERGLGNGHAFFSKECNILRSFAKEGCVACVLLRSLQKNVAMFAFFYVLCKRTLRSLHIFTFLRKERKRTHRFFGFHKSLKTRKKTQKNVACFKRTQKNDAFRT